MRPHKTLMSSYSVLIAPATVSTIPIVILVLRSFLLCHRVDGMVCPMPMVVRSPMPA